MVRSDLVVFLGTCIMFNGTVESHYNADGSKISTHAVSQTALFCLKWAENEEKQHCTEGFVDFGVHEAP